MDEYERERVGRIIRWSVGLPLFLFSYPWLGIFGPFLMLLGAILIGPDIAAFCSRAFTNIVWSHRPGEDKPSYDRARGLTLEGSYIEAEKEYERILEEYPGEVRPHIDLMDIAASRLNNPELVERFYQRGMSMLEEDEEAKERLTNMYNAVRQRLKTEEDIRPSKITYHEADEDKHFWHSKD